MTTHQATLPATAQKAAAHEVTAHRRLLKHVLELKDFQRFARKRLPKAIYAYVAAGAEEETTLRTNREAFLDWRLITRVLVGVAERSQETELFGKKYAAPFGIAPMGGSSVVTYNGALNMARAATKSRIPFVLSANCIIPMEEIGRYAPGAWFAAYQSPNRKAIEGIVERAARAGFSVLVLTADVPVGSNREATQRAGFTFPIRPNARLAWDGITHPSWLITTAARTLLRRGIPRIENLEPDGGPNLFSSAAKSIAAHEDLSWEHVRLMRKLWKGPFVVKGILSKEDVKIAGDSGVDGIIISNHGGRQLDHAATPLQVLPEIVETAGDLTVMIDSGFRRGTDILTALSLGARFVFVGRPFLFAAALAGEAGVSHGIALLSKEIDTDMALLGERSIADAGADHLLRVR